MADLRKSPKILEGCNPDTIPYDDLVAAAEPVVLKGLVSSWELVGKGLDSPSEAIAYLKSYYNGLNVGVYLGGPEVAGKFSYSNDLTELNFEKIRMRLDAALELMEQHLGDEQPPTVYVGSTSMDICMPALQENNHLDFNSPMFEQSKPLSSIWIGNRSTAAAHFDAPNNIACVAVGRRRFTLFPPDQIANLYPGPLEPTPGGQVVTLVDLQQPDFSRFPGYRAAQDAAFDVELEPGDAVFIPSMWWHQVEGLGAFNVLINYWWTTTPSYLGTPMNALYHAMLSLRDRPVEEKRAWKNLFDYYVFGDPENARSHLPEAAWGLLGPMDEMNARKLRAMLLNKLNR